MQYSKPPLTLDEQIDLLVRRGMVVADRDRARHYLAHVNYYRLRGYWLPFEQAGGGNDHRFAAGTSFDDALSLYVFDRQLRLLLLDAIERIEVSLRTRWAHLLSVKYGSHAQLREDIFADSGKHQRCLEALREEIERSHERFIEHYRNKYTDPELPPIWAASEVMSLGQLSKWFDNLKHHPDRREIAAVYGIDESVLRSFMHHLTHVRNLCAHHSRLWNRRFTFTMRIPRNPRHIAGWFNHRDDRKLYNTLVMLGYLLSIISPDSKWVPHVRRLIGLHAQAKPAAMGFPEGWEKLALWEKAA